MSRTPDSLTSAERQLLEFLARSELHLPPSVIEFNGDYTAQHYSNLMQELHADGYLVREQRGPIPFYAITDAGRELLHGAQDS